MIPCTTTGIIIWVWSAGQTEAQSTIQPVLCRLNKTLFWKHLLTSTSQDKSISHVREINFTTTDDNTFFVVAICKPMLWTMGTWGTDRGETIPSKRCDRSYLKRVPCELVWKEKFDDQSTRSKHKTSQTPLCSTDLDRWIKELNLIWTCRSCLTQNYCLKSKWQQAGRQVCSSANQCVSQCLNSRPSKPFPLYNLITPLSLSK